MSEPAAQRQGAALAVATMLLVVWGTNFSIIKLVMSHITPGAFLFARYIVTPACAVILLLAVHGTRWPKLPRQEWQTLAWLTVLGHVLHVTLINWGIYLSSPFSTALIVACGPLMTLINRGCQRAVRTGAERLDQELMERVKNDEASEAARLELQAALEKKRLTSRPRSRGRRAA